jgi:hypothetical protein
MREARPILPGDDRRFIWSIVAAQVLVQIGAFSLPALLPATSQTGLSRRPRPAR